MFFCNNPFYIIDTESFIHPGASVFLPGNKEDTKPTR